MPEDGSIESNVEKGRGIVKKDRFKVIGVDKQDRETSGSGVDDPEARGRGRPRQDTNWTKVGPDAEQEQGDE